MQTISHPRYAKICRVLEDYYGGIWDGDITLEEFISQESITLIRQAAGSFFKIVDNETDDVLWVTHSLFDFVTVYDTDEELASDM